LSIFNSYDWHPCLIHSILSKSLRQGKRLYCCFIDYVKAFDSVSHFKLWLKLAKCGVTGKLLNLIKSTLLSSLHFISLVLIVDVNSFPICETNDIPL
jgi:hypothetical protein